MEEGTAKAAGFIKYSSMCTGIDMQEPATCKVMLSEASKLPKFCHTVESL